MSMEKGESRENGTVSDTAVKIIVPCQSERLIMVAKEFENTYQDLPDFYVRVPGRVNLIGEHIDYCGYPVFPMALEQDIVIGVKATREQTLHIRNADKKYPDFKCIITELSIPGGAPMWYHYVLCGIRGVLEDMRDTDIPVGVKFLVSGTIPPAAGLSSSSALVSATVLAFTYANKMFLGKEPLATLSAAAERFIGTQGGGMDQAIAFFAKIGCAQFIEWDPLRSKSICLPKDAVFVIAHSLHEANKAATQDFNCRVMECKLAAMIIAKKSDLEWKSITKLAKLQKELNLPLEVMSELTITVLTNEKYDQKTICEMLEISESDLVVEILTKNTADIEHFKLRQRAFHVFQEALRVERFKAICLQAEQIDSIESENDSFAQMGRLMRESHFSLETLYECSHENLDTLVKLSDQMGIACRLTGAGWGGCIVALCRRGTEEIYMEALRENYYKNHPNLRDRNIDDLIFCTSPQGGANIFDITRK